MFCFHSSFHFSLGRKNPALKPLCLNSLGKPSMMEAFMKSQWEELSVMGEAGSIFKRFISGDGRSALAASSAGKLT